MQQPQPFMPFQPNRTAGVWRNVRAHAVPRFDPLVTLESTHKTLLHAMPDGMFIAHGGHFVFANPALLALLGYSHSAFVGLPFEQVIAPEFLARWKRQLQLHAGPQAGGAPQSKQGYLVRLCKSNAQEEVWVELHASRLDFEGHPSVLGIVHDTTEQRRREQRGHLRDHVLERLARGAGLESVLHAIVFATEEVIPHMCCAVSVLHPNGQDLTLQVAPNLPASLGQALVAIGLEPNLDPDRDLVRLQQVGIQAAWSESVLDASGAVVGVFSAYYSVACAPSRADRELLQHALHLAGLAIERKRSEELIWRQANFDMLTQLPNRNMLLERLSQDIKQASREGRSLALLSIDLDNFKEVNEALGQARGDQVLMEAARRIAQGVGPANTVARMGSNEFVAILPLDDASEQVDCLILRLLALLSAPYALESGSVVVSASVGLALHPHDANDRESLLSNATQAMQMAKARGGNQFCHFTSALQQAAQARAQMVRDLHVAVAEQQFVLHFQPIADLHNGQVHKAEALLRWQHPVHGMVSPAEFIPLAEETGLIVDIGNWVFHEAALWAKRWRQLDGQFQISINKSPAQFDRHGLVAQAWLDQLKALDLPGQAIVVEITEGLLLNSESHVASTMNAYRAAGVQLAIDDFGTGYSALSYLKKFNIDYLKIDQSFTRNLADGSSDLALCEAMVVMAHRLGLKVVAEGLETQVQRQLLVDMGCDHGQGYLLAKPVPAEVFEAWLANQRKSVV